MGAFVKLVPPSVKPVPSTGLVVVKKGEPVTLSCDVTGNPLPVVTWTREVSRDSSPFLKSQP